MENKQFVINFDLLGGFSPTWEDEGEHVLPSRRVKPPKASAASRGSISPCRLAICLRAWLSLNHCWSGGPGGGYTSPALMRTAYYKYCKCSWWEALTSRVLPVAPYAFSPHLKVTYLCPPESLRTHMDQRSPLNTAPGLLFPHLPVNIAALQVWF